MRVKSKELKQPAGTIRVKSKYLWFPKSINGEWRWLEKASYKQIYEYDFGSLWNDELYSWYDLGWVD